jgi:type I restriction enzyme S subunit
MSGIASWVTAKDLRHRLDADFYRPEYLEFDHRAEARGLKLRQVVEFSSLVTDGTHKTPNYVDSGVPFLSAKNIRNGFVDASSGHKYVSAAEFDQLERWNCAPQPEDVLVAKSGSIGASGLAKGGYDRFAVFESVAVIRPVGVSSAYLSAYLNSRLGQLQIRRNSKGAVIRHLHLEDLREVEVPLPDRRIQDYIGAKVELAERCRAAAEDHWQKAVGLFQSLFAWSAPPQFSLTSVSAVAELEGRLDPKYYRREYLDAVREITACEHGWEPIGDLVAEVSNGIEYRQFCSDGVPYLTVTNVEDGDLDTDGAPRIPVDAPISDRGRIVESDVLVVRTGSIGQAAVVQRDAASAIISSHFIRLRLDKGDLGQGAWLAFFLNTELGKALQFRVAYGAVQPQIGQDELLRLPVPRLKAEVRRALVRGFLSRSALRAHARRLVNEAKADVEALIEGTLDVQAILAGTVKAPTADAIPELAEDGA